MRDHQRSNNFVADLFKCFLIWKLLSLLVRGLIFVCKVIFTALLQLAYLITIGIKKLIPIIKAKFEQFKLDYKQKYRPKIKAAFFRVKEYFSNFFYKCKNKTISFKFKNKIYSKIKNKEEKHKNHSVKKTKKQRTHKESDFTLKVKKIKYWIIDFFYTYEFHIVITGIIVLIIIVTFIVLKMTTK